MAMRCMESFTALRMPRMELSASWRSSAPSQLLLYFSISWEDKHVSTQHLTLSPPLSGELGMPVLSQCPALTLGHMVWSPQGQTQACTRTCRPSLQSSPGVPAWSTSGGWLPHTCRPATHLAQHPEALQIRTSPELHPQPDLAGARPTGASGVHSLVQLTSPHC